MTFSAVSLIHDPTPIILMRFPAFARFDENKTQNLPPIEFSKTLNVLRESVQCPLDEASVNIDIGAEVDAQISLSVIASGSIVPPEFDEFSIITGNLHPLSSVVARLIGSTGIDASLLGSLDVVSNALVCFPWDLSHNPRANTSHREPLSLLPLLCSK